MAQIIINEISSNYTYSVGSNSFATVALPITACWGPAFLDPASTGKTVEELLDETVWQRFPSTQEGLEAFTATYRGPASNYRLVKDYSYNMAMTLLTIGYDVLVCRLCPGTTAKTSLAIGDATLNIEAKYPGTFGNNLQVLVRKVVNAGASESGTLGYCNLIVYVIDTNGSRTALENLTFVFDQTTLDNNYYSNLQYIDEVESDFLTLSVTGVVSDEGEDYTQANPLVLSGGADKAADPEEGTVASLIGTLPASSGTLNVITNPSTAADYAYNRYFAVYGQDTLSCEYLTAYSTLISAIEGSTGTMDVTTASNLRYMEWIYTYACEVYELLTDKLSYNPNRIISPGWDDQNITNITGATNVQLKQISPIHSKLMYVAYYSRCATALLDVPKCEGRAYVWNESTDTNEQGYAQLLSRSGANIINATSYDVNIALYPSHSALMAPWGQYTYVGTNKLATAPPAFMALMIQIAMLKNQSTQYEWLLPTSRRNTLNFGKFDYNITKKVLDEWQQLEGVSVNIITNIPDLGTTLWGNSTLFEVPPATYQALANLSTRYLVNAVEDVVYRCGIAITFQYNNDQAYSAFYAGVTPTLDSMVNCGAIEDYYIRMSADINGVDSVNANTVIGKIYLVINGVINDIVVDLVCLPPATDLTPYREN